MIGLARTWPTAVIVSGIFLAVASSSIGSPGPAAADPIARDDVRCERDLARPTPPAPRSVPGQDEQIARYRIGMLVGSGGEASFVEHLTYDFGDAPGRSGLTRSLVLRVPCREGLDRVHPLSELEVTSPTGAPVDVIVEERGATTQIHIGRAGPPVVGGHEYHLRYRLGGFGGPPHGDQEMLWHLVGEGWDVPIVDLEARVETPVAAVSRPMCWAGRPAERRRCTDVRPGGAVTLIEQDRLAPGEPLSLSVPLPPGTLRPGIVVASADVVASAEVGSTEGARWTLPVGALLLLAAMVTAAMVATSRRRAEAPGPNDPTGGQRMRP